MVIIRVATESDLPQILNIYNEIILHTTGIYYYEPHTLEMRREWFFSRKEAGFPVFVAEESGQILGMSSIGQFRIPTAYKYSVENTVHVAASVRGRGIGKLLMTPLIESARHMNMHSIIAVVDADNAVSIGLHKGFGFMEVAHFKEVGYKFDRWLDLKFLQLLLF